MKSNSKGAAKSADTLTVDSFSIDRVKEFDKSVLADITLNGIKIYGMSVMTNKDGEDFLSFPSRKGKDGKYYSIVWAKLSEKDSADILAEIQKKLDE